MEVFDYDNIVLLPRKCRVNSRSECDTDVEFGSQRFALPVVPSNMKAVIDEPIAEMSAGSSHFYVMHRFDLDCRSRDRRGARALLNPTCQPTSWAAGTTCT